MKLFFAILPVLLIWSSSIMAFVSDSVGGISVGDEGCRIVGTDNFEIKPDGKGVYLIDESVDNEFHAISIKSTKFDRVPVSSVQVEKGRARSVLIKIKGANVERVENLGRNSEHSLPIYSMVISGRLVSFSGWSDLGWSSKLSDECFSLAR